MYNPIIQNLIPVLVKNILEQNIAGICVWFWFIVIFSYISLCGCTLIIDNLERVLIRLLDLMCSVADLAVILPDWWSKIYLSWRLVLIMNRIFFL